MSQKKSSFYVDVNSTASVKNTTARIWVSRQILASLVVGAMLLGAAVPIMANPIQDENAIPPVAADYLWNVHPAPTNLHDIEGYADKTSVHVGSSIKFYASVNPALDQQYTLTVYRLGWYHGVGARRMIRPVALSSTQQTLPTPDPVTGLVEANWTNAYTLNVPWNWVSGVYIATLVGNTTGKGQNIPFVVKRNDSRAAYLFQTSDTTWQAYNNWGGKSLYSFNSTNGAPARKVSYNRPYAGNSGMGQLTLWELQMLRFLEREGYDVTYQSNIDTHDPLSGQWQLTKHKAFLSVGHDEYWTRNIRNNVENAKGQGLSLGFFGANAAYWQIRLESSPTTGGAYRTIVGYKDVARTEDPYALDNNTGNDVEITTLWRDTRYYDRPENTLMGVMYFYHPVNGDMVVSNATHWVYSGTGLKNGDKLVGLLGYEVDAYWSNGKAPAGVEILAHSPINETNTGYSGTPVAPASREYFSEMSIYEQACTLSPCYSSTGKATVFATGTMQWNWGLDSFYTGRSLENVATQRVTRNVLARMVGAPLPSNRNY